MQYADVTNKSFRTNFGNFFQQDHFMKVQIHPLKKTL